MDCGGLQLNLTTSLSGLVEAQEVSMWRRLGWRMSMDSPRVKLGCLASICEWMKGITGEIHVLEVQDGSQLACCPAW